MDLEKRLEAAPRTIGNRVYGVLGVTIGALGLLYINSYILRGVACVLAVDSFGDVMTGYRHYFGRRLCNMLHSDS